MDAMEISASALTAERTRTSIPSPPEMTRVK